MAGHPLCLMPTGGSALEESMTAALRELHGCTGGSLDARYYEQAARHMQSHRGRIVHKQQTYGKHSRVQTIRPLWLRCETTGMVLRVVDLDNED